MAGRDEIAPDLPATARERVLDNAAGNPLGLVEFAAAVARLGPGTLLPQWLPLSTRVERSLSRIFPKLDIGSRNELARVLPGE